MQQKKISQIEYIVLMAALMTVPALAIDAILPALDIIGDSIGTISNSENQSLIIMIFLGLGIGPLFFGPISDSVGRKPPVYVGFAIFIIGSVLSLIFSNIITRPIQQLTEAATEVSKGNTSVKINITTKDKIGYLATCFIEMVENIKKSIEKQVDGIFKSANSLYKSSQNISTTVKDQSIIMNQQSEKGMEIIQSIQHNMDKITRESNQSVESVI
jgi:methyl-accepting chemotaxis protein